MMYLLPATTQDVYVTLKEKETLSLPNYLFYFKHRTTNEVVAFVKLYATDISDFKDRYNKFSIITNSYFSTSTSGEWQYFIYEQTSTSNINPALTTSQLENGFMRLGTIGTVAYDTYSTTNTFKTR